MKRWQFDSLSFLLVIGLGLCSAVPDGNAVEDSQMVRQDLVLLFADLHPQGTASIMEYFNRKGVDVATVVFALNQFVEEGWNAEDTSSNGVLCSKASIVLADLGARGSVPLLKRMSTSSDGNRRNQAIRAIVRIEGAEAAGFAKEVVANHEQYSDINRLVLFQTLLDLARKGSNNEKIIQFLAEALATEPDTSNICLIDSTLSTMSDQYRRSFEREEALKEASLGPAGMKMPDFFSRALGELSSMPKEQRTRLAEAK